ncbi:nucleoside hydrolase [Agrococcus sp. Marseille-Q4369]|uniref:nucleoside hydrolase n=1 Tax=Agrococcus sp. Marseille-Q4369 TaxID=2810513 RepID=UPI001B8C9245|nr:nucleoside hydrolase [Agrococcus sp. Marseille-Q4369]QUW17839.1 nucleoside hydrolase [Agrococcus sp. Marseille-Q4369]
MRKVIVDTDTGVDDALALMILAADPDVEILAVVSVFGNCHGDRAADNARYVLDTCGRQDVPVYRGSDEPLRQAIELSSGVHGDDGFGNTGLRPETSVPAEPSGIPIILDLVRQHPGEVDYLALGPQTNLARALELEPDLLRRLRSTTIVGTLGPALWNDTEPWADRRFRVSRDPNVSFDIDAAEIVASHEGDVTWCGPYVTRQALVPEQFFLDIAGSTGYAPAELITKISHDYAGFYSRSYGREDARVMGINDSLAVATLLRPDLVAASVQRPLQTFTDEATDTRYLAGVHPSPGETRPLHRVIMDMDFSRVLELIEDTLRRPLPWPAEPTA